MGFRATDGPRVRMFKKRVTLSLPPMVYDLIIIGGGPAGLTAGVYARTRKLSTLILEAQAIGGQLEWLYPTKSVYDYPSYIAIEGGELAQLFVLHSRESGAELRSEEVVDIQREPSGFRVRTREGNAFETRTILLAMGMGLFEPKRLDVPGETELEGKGVEYRVRDRHEFKDKRVIVVGGGDSALEIALEIFAAAKKVILVHRRGEFRAMEKNVEAVLKSPIEVEGERLIKVKADMSTSVRGIYACGDIVSYPGKDKRIVTGCGEAVTAIMSVYKYLKQPYWA